jgi:uncharacterized protein (TIGR02285 family)
MPQKRAAVRLGTLLLALLWSQQGMSREQVTWLRFDYPPMYIVSGPQAGEGYMDHILQLLIDNLPEYDHTVRVANLSRIMSELEANNVCIASLFVNEERKRLGWISSGNTTLLPPVQLVYRAADSEKFTRFGSPASLYDVLREPSLVLGVAERMSYGVEVDKAVAAHNQQANVYLRSGADVGLGLHEMLMKHRIDYTVNYSWAANYTAGPEQAKQLAFLPFIEAGEQPKHHVICSKGTLGKDVVDRVDTLLKDPELSARRREYISRWLPDSARESYSETFNQYFGIPAAE